MALTLKEIRAQAAELAAQLESGDIKKKEKSVRAEDPRSWYPKFDKDGVSTSIIRFLPSGAAKPWVTTISHNYQGKSGGWMNELCPTMFGEKCPQCEDNSTHYEGKEIVSGDQKVRERLRRTKNFVNILVVDDKAVPENNGGVFYFKHGNDILDIIAAKSKKVENQEGLDEEDRIEAARPFDVDNGHDFVLKTKRKLNKQIDYSDSIFKKKARPIAVGKTPQEADDNIQAILDQCYDLSEFVDKKNVKTWDQLSERMAAIAGSGNKPTNAASSTGTPRARAPAVEVADEEVDEEYLRSFIEPEIV